VERRGEQVGDPKFITLEVKPLGPSTAQEIGTFSLKMKGPTPQEVTGKYLVVWEKVGTDWKLSADTRALSLQAPLPQLLPSSERPPRLPFSWWR
jgi:ketosteroid isomerase-like protein